MPGILFATHGGPSAEGAARLARLLSERLHAPLHLLAVMEPLPTIDYGYGVTYAPTQEEEAALRRELLASSTAQVRRAGIAAGVPDLRFGAPSAEIAAAARAVHADVIVIGLGSHDVVQRALGGETALHLVQVATTPVLAVPDTATALPRRVVAALDFSPTSVRAVETVAPWLTAGDVLDLVHVEAARHAPRGAADEATRRLRDLASELRLASGVRVQNTPLQGDPARALLEELERVDGELIVLGSHGYGFWKRLMLGSVASKVIRLSTRSVLVAPIGCL